MNLNPTQTTKETDLIRKPLETYNAQALTRSQTMPSTNDRDSNDKILKSSSFFLCQSMHRLELSKEEAPRSLKYQSSNSDETQMLPDNDYSHLKGKFEIIQYRYINELY